MTNETYILSAVIAVVFGLIRYAMIRYRKEDTAIKYVVMDMLVVFASSVVGCFVIEQTGQYWYPITGGNHVPVYTGEIDGTSAI